MSKKSNIKEMEQEEYDYLFSIIYTLKNRLDEIKPLLQEISSKGDNWNYDFDNSKTIMRIRDIVVNHKHTAKDLDNSIKVLRNVINIYQYGA